MSVFFITGTLLYQFQDKIGYPDDTLFIMLESEAFTLLTECKYNFSAVCQRLNVPEAAWREESIYLVKVPQSALVGCNISNGNEMGVDNKWVPGGKHINGFNQVVIKPVSLNDCQIMEVTWSV